MEVKGFPPAVRGAFSVGDAGGGGAGVVAGAVVVVVVVVVVSVEVSGVLLSFELHPTASHVIAVRAIPPATSDRRLVGDLILLPICSVEPRRCPGFLGSQLDLDIVPSTRPAQENFRRPPHQLTPSRTPKVVKLMPGC
jgi:hypothetical protein